MEQETNCYGETYSQAWPVTPYTIVASIEGTVIPADHLIMTTVYVDGAKAAADYLGPRHTSRNGTTLEFKGFQANSGTLVSSMDETTEFLFCLPRPRPRQPGAPPPVPNPDAGTIKVAHANTQTHEHAHTRA